MNTNNDDGSLSFLEIEPDKNSKNLINKLSKKSKYEIKFRR
jgi:hypothetical protein